jgi:hypothetical protein
MKFEIDAAPGENKTFTIDIPCGLLFTGIVYHSDPPRPVWEGEPTLCHKSHNGYIYRLLGTDGRFHGGFVNPASFVIDYKPVKKLVAFV